MRVIFVCMHQSDTCGRKRNKVGNKSTVTLSVAVMMDGNVHISYIQLDVFNALLVRHRSLVLQHQEDGGHPGFGRRVHADHVPSQVKGD